MKKIIFIISIMAIVSCSSENQEAEIESGTIEREGIEQTIGNDFFEAEKTTQEVGFKIYENDNIFSVNDFINAGLKKPKEFPINSKDKDGSFITPKATSIHLGWYKHSELKAKDLELRFYSNHEDALKFGKTSAEKALNNLKTGGRNGNMDLRTSFWGGFIISGNTVILCQTSIDVCDEILSNIKNN